MSIFGWIQTMGSGKGPLEDLIGKFGGMLASARRSFDMATEAYLAGADAEATNQAVVENDEGINELHRKIRRGLVIHASLRGAGEVPFSLVMISVAKDAELIGDYAKHICRLALRSPKAPGSSHHETLFALRTTISEALAEAGELFESEDTDKARVFVERAEALTAEIEAQTLEILSAREAEMVSPADPAATVLCYRYYGRIISHAVNIVTSIVLPVDYLDYYDEDPESRGPDPTKKDKKKKKKDKKKKDKKKDKKRKKDKKK
ncbi:MAG: PhoU domain-containing protein [Planctomycetota bacterium]|nr:PhoU domain-containing protein [Planctomycetota bacterium]